MKRARKVLVAVLAAIVIAGSALIGVFTGSASGCCIVNPTDSMWAGQLSVTTTSTGYVTVNPLDNFMPAAPYRAIHLTLASPLGGQPSLPYSIGVAVNSPDPCHFTARLIDTTGHVFVGTATLTVEAMWSAEDPAPIGCTG